MKWRWASLALPFLATAPAAAQQYAEFGLQGVATFARRDFAGAGPGAWFRSGQGRFGVSVMPGVRDESFAVRGELVAHFILSPDNTRVTPYGGGGIAGITGDDDSDGYLLLVFGLEFNPRAGSGWALEAGIGGGFRLGAVVRWRKSR